MIEGWQTGQFSDLADIEMGQSPNSETCNDKGIGTPLLNGPTEFNLRFPVPVQFTTDPKRISKRHDILFCVRGSTTGRMNWGDQVYAIGRGIAGIRHQEGPSYRYYVRGILDYYLKSMLASATGSTFPNISRNQLESLAILIPPLPEQKAIAGVLSSLDDKIDLLHRQNKTLEALAETLFRQWFIEEARDDWEDKPLKDICTIKNGHAFKSKDYRDGGQKVIRTLNFENHTIKLDKLVYLGLDDAKKYERFLIKRNDFLLVMVGASLGNFAIVTDHALPALQNQNMWRFQANENKFQHYLNFALRHLVSRNLKIASGSARQFFQKGAFYELKILFPPKKLVEKFNEFAESTFSKTEVNLKQIQTLENLRDTLLPKLMSGKVRVEFDSEAV